MSIKYRGIFEYEYPSNHQPVGIDVHINGECIKGEIIEWEYKPISPSNQNQAASHKSKFDKMRAEIENCQTKNEALVILDKYAKESEW